MSERFQLPDEVLGYFIDMMGDAPPGEFVFYPASYTPEGSLGMVPTPMVGPTPPDPRALIVGFLCEDEDFAVEPWFELHAEALKVLNVKEEEKDLPLETI